MTISAPFIPPLGLKPKPTQPVVLTTSSKVMFPCSWSKPQLRRARRFWSRNSPKGRSEGSDVCVLSVQRNMKKRGRKETMMCPWACRRSKWAWSLRNVPPHLPPTHLHCWMGSGDKQICTVTHNPAKRGALQLFSSNVNYIPWYIFKSFRDLIRSHFYLLSHCWFLKDQLNVHIIFHDCWRLKHNLNCTLFCH